MSLNSAKRITIVGLLVTGAAGVWGYSQLSKTSPVIVEQPEELVDERVALQVVDIIERPVEDTEFNHLDLIRTTEGVEARIIELRNSNQMLIENFIEQNDDINWFNIGDRENAKVNLLRTFVRRNTQNFLQIDIDVIYDELNPILDTIINSIPENITNLSRSEIGKHIRILESHLRSIEWFTHSGRSVPERFTRSFPRAGFRHTTEVALRDNPEEAIRDYIRVNLPENISYQQVENLVVFSEEENWTENYRRIINDVNDFYMSTIDFDLHTEINTAIFNLISENYNIPENITPTNSRSYWGWVFWLFREELRDQVLAPYEEGTYEWSQKEAILSSLGPNVRIQEREESFSQLVPEIYNNIRRIDREKTEIWNNLTSQRIGAVNNNKIRDRINVNNPFYGSGDTFNRIAKEAVNDTFRNHPKMKEVREKIKLIRDTRDMLRDLR